VAYTATGKTFPHKETLKALGGKWNPEKSAWTFGHLNVYDRDKISKLVGVQLVDDYAKPQPIVADEPEPVAETIPNDHFFGDDRQWCNYFAPKNPLATFGFSTFSQLVKYVENIDMRGYDYNRKIPWNNESDFHGTDTMREALSIAKDGWDEGVNKAIECSEYLSAEHAQQKKFIHSVAGARVNVGRLLANNPVHMKRRTKRDGKRIVTLFVETFQTWQITVETSILRASIVAAMVDLMECAGYQCEIIAVATADDNRTERPGYQITTCVKTAGEKLNLNDVIFALGHPSMLRRLYFGCVASTTLLRNCHRGYGLRSRSFNYVTKPAKNEIYIPQFKYEHQRKLAKLSEREKALFVFEHIGAETPINIEGDD
jgi:hypothetical protein